MLRKNFVFFTLLFYIVISMVSTLNADNTTEYSLGKITVTGEFILPTKQTGDSIYTGTKVTKNGIELAGESGSNSVYETFSLLPGINIESKDPYGLSDKNVRIRGIKNYYSGMAVNGIPNYGIMPIGPREDIYDMENMESISIYKGATPSDMNTGTGNRGGSVDLTFRKPLDKLSASIKEAFGSDSYSKTFLRIDSGKLPTDTKMFASYSYADADMWRGKGDLGEREHINFGISQEITDKFSSELYFNFNNSNRNFFMPLTYEEAKDVDSYYSKHYNSTFYANPSKDVNYYDFNKGNFINRDIFAIFKYQFSDSIATSIKPYFSTEDANYFETTTKTTPTGKNYLDLKKMRKSDKYGVIPEVSMNFQSLNITTGYWFESFDLDKSVKIYGITPKGITYKGYQYYGKNDNRGVIHSPYLKLSQNIDKFTWQGGLKYFYYEEPEIKGYSGGKYDPDLTVSKSNFDKLLPTAGIGYKLNQHIETYLNYGKNYMRPYAYVPITNLYSANKTKFKASGILLDDIFKDWKMETSDNVDFGLRFNTKYIEINSTIFYGKHYDLLTNIFDPTVGINYYQNVGDATSYGAELETFIYPLEGLILFFNPSYTNITFDNDFTRVQNGKKYSVKIEGNQLPDTPEWIIKTGFIYRINNFEINPNINWIDTRYGDATNNDSLPSYTLVNLGLSYNIKKILAFNDIKLSLEFKNLFNKKYISVIDASDDSESGTTSYYSGSPFSTIFSISANF